MNTLPSELDFQVLLELDDEYLLNMCSTDKHYHQICSSMSFWKERTRRRYEYFLHLKKYFSGWQEFYRVLSRNTVYVITYAEEVAITSDIRTAYKMALLRITNDIDVHIDSPTLENAHQFSRWANFVNIPIQIYIMMDGIEISMSDPDFLLFNIGKTEGLPNFHIHSDFYSLPSFSSTGSFLWYIFIPENLRDWVGSPETSIGLGRPTTTFLERIFTYGKQGLLFNDQFEIIPINKQIRRPDIFWYQKHLRVFGRIDFPPIIIRKQEDSFWFTIIPEDFYKNFIRVRRGRDLDEEDENFINRDLFWQVYLNISKDILWFPIQRRTTFPPLQLEYNDFMYL